MPRAWMTIILGLLLATVGCEPVDFGDSSSSNAEYLRGRELLKRGELQAALAALNKAVQADPKNAEAYTSIGDIHRKEGNYDLARANYITACTLSPYSFRPHYNLAVTYQILADLAVSGADAAENLRNAVGTYIRALAIKPQSFDSQLNLGVCYYQLGKNGLAEHHTLQASRIKPNDPRPYNNLAMLYESTGRMDEALKAYRKSIEVDSKQPEILLALGQIYLDRAEYRSAMAFFRAAARQAPADPTPMQRIGICYFRQRKLNEAIEAFQQAMRIDARSPASYRGYGVVCMYRYLVDEANDDLRRRAVKAWKFCLELNPDQPDLQKLVEQYDR